MNPDYSWKDNTQIDPSFRPSDSDYVVAVVPQTRPDVDSHTLVTSPIALKMDSGPDDRKANMLSGSQSESQQDPRMSPMQEGIKEKPVAGRRALSSTKRAAQNRNAQKAFRQRREKYIKELEATASEVAELHKTIEELRQENLQLRDYTLALQSRLIELSPNVNVGNVTHTQT